MNDFKSTFSLGQKIAKQYYILARLEAADILSRLTTTIIGIIIALILIIITIVYLSISLCYFVDTLIGNMAISALIIAAFNLLLCIIVFLFRNFIFGRIIRRIFIKTLFRKEKVSTNIELEKYKAKYLLHTQTDQLKKQVSEQVNETKEMAAYQTARYISIYTSRLLSLMKYTHLILSFYKKFKKKGKKKISLA